MKIAVFTFVGSKNYGSRLQAYALWRYLSDRGRDVDLIRVRNLSLRDRIASAGEILWHSKLYSIANQGVCRVRKCLSAAAETRILYDVSDVSRDGFGQKIVSVGRSKLKGLNRNYDVFICGSDQIWSPLALPLKKHFYLTFVKGKKKIAYAASFGLSEYPGFNRRQFRYIAKMDRISVRENTGREIVRKYLGRDCTVAVDPVFLLPRETWTEIAGRPDEEEYAFLFFLNRNDAISQIEEKMRQRGVPIRTMEGISAPEEFVRLIAGAKYVFTDSFHASAFSLIFHRDFYCFRRNLPSEIQQESRLLDLLRDLSIAGRYAESADGLIFPGAPIDYDRADALLSERIEASESFLETSLTE